MKSIVKILTMTVMMSVMTATAAFANKAKPVDAKADVTTAQLAATTTDSIAIDSATMTASDYPHRDRPGKAIELAEERGSDWGVLVPILGVIFSVGGPIILVIMIFYFSYRNKRNRFKVIEKAIEHGVANEQLEKLFEEQKSRKLSPLFSGMACFMAGAGCFVAYFMFGADKLLGIIGLIALMVGLGMIIAYRIDKKERADEEKDKTEDSSKK